MLRLKLAKKKIRPTVVGQKENYWGVHFKKLSGKLMDDKVSKVVFVGDLMISSVLRDHLNKEKLSTLVYINTALNEAATGENFDDPASIFSLDLKEFDGIVITCTSEHEFRVHKELIDQLSEGKKVYKCVIDQGPIKVRDSHSLFLKSLYKRPGGKLGARTGRISVLFYPGFSDQSRLFEEYHKLLWYLPCQRGVRVVIPVEKQLYRSLPDPSRFPKSAMLGHWSLTNSHVEFICTQDNEFENLARIHDVALVWDTRGFSGMDYEWLDRSPNIFIIDKHHFRRRAGFNYSYLDYFIQPTRVVEEIRIRSKINFFNAMADMGQVKKAYIFGSGPSLQQAFKFDYSDGVGIVCNTLVKNARLLDHVKPRFIVAADADYHFGCALYDARFREDLLRAMNRTGAKLVCPEFFAPLMLHHYPEIEADLIGIPVLNGPLNINLQERFWLSAKDNIFNLLLMPLASAVADQVILLGFDGKKPGDEKFWGYDPKSQYQELIRSIEFCNPAFYQFVDYDDAFRKHCALVEDIITYCESRGRGIFSLTPSRIPAISSRYLKK